MIAALDQTSAHKRIDESGQNRDSGGDLSLPWTIPVFLETVT